MAVIPGPEALLGHAAQQVSDRDAEARIQAGDLAGRLRASLGEALVGVYLHGSIVLGGFNPELSDLDVLAVTRRRTTVDEKRLLVEIVADASGNPSPLEFHLVAQADLRPWQHPTPFDFHYSDVWRDALRADLAEALGRQGDADPDLAAHVMVVRQRGVAIDGPPPADVFPDVPWDDYADSLLRDLRWARSTDRPWPVYRVLSPARIWATLATREIQSKDSGGAWALERIRADLRPVLADALARYRGDTAAFNVDEATLDRYGAYVETEVLAIASR
jgi:predicted nucleotidyltransferase